jgi:hypothetical protein
MHGSQTQTHSVVAVVFTVVVVVVVKNASRFSPF